MDNGTEFSFAGLTDEQQALLDMFLEKEDFQEEKTEDGKPVLVIRPEDRYKPFPLTDIQLAYVIGRENNSLDMSNVSSHAYIEFLVKDVDADRYSEAWNKLIRRHDTLRTIILPNGTQRVLENVPEYKVEVYDFRGLTEEKALEGLQGIRDKYAQDVKSLDLWPSFDIVISRYDDHCLIHASIEGLFGDVKSYQLMMLEVMQYYNNPDLVLPELELTFRDYVLSLENRRSMKSYHEAEEYWKKRIPTLPYGPVLPARNESEVSAPVVKPYEREMDERRWQALQKHCTDVGLSPTSILLAAFSEVLRRWNAEENFCLNLTLFNRLPLHPQIDELIGDFTDTLLLECRGDDGSTFLERATALRNRLWTDLDNRQYSGMDVLREMNRYNSEKSNVYMPVVFTSTFLMGEFCKKLTTMHLDGNPLSRYYGTSQTPQLLIDHQVYEDEGKLHVHWDCRSEYFEDGYLDSMIDAFMKLLHRLADEPALWDERNVVELPENELAVRAAYNETSAPVCEKLMHRLFLEKSAEIPDSPAVFSPSAVLSYRELRDYVAAVNERLRGRVEPDELVAIVMEKGWEQVAAVLGIQCAGAAYLPIDPGMPAERAGSIIADAGVRFVLTQSGVTPNWPDSVQALSVDTLSPGNGAELLDLPDVQRAENLAYVIYTSGSTGKPKGVMIEHRAAVNTILDVNKRFGIGTGDRSIALANLGFDLSVWDIFGLLAAGGAVVIPDSARAKEPSHWSELVRDFGVTVWNSVPAMMRMMVEYASSGSMDFHGTLRQVLLSGDWIPLGLPDSVRKLFGAGVCSLGGATEASIWSIAFPVGEVAKEWKSIPYGMPMANQHFYVLNEKLQDCPSYVKGALYIGGIGLARGYYHDRDKTDAAFIIHPVTGERLYRTGDLGYFDPKGYIVIQGREDTQVKINGFRVELGEIEHAVRLLPGVSESAALALKENGSEQIAAYLSVKSREPEIFSEEKAEFPEWKEIFSYLAGTEFPFMFATGGKAPFPVLDSLHLDTLHPLFRGLGIFVESGDSATIDEIIRRGEISPRYYYWMMRALNRLVDAGYLVEKNGRWHGVKPLEDIKFEDLPVKYKHATSLMVESAVNIIDILRENIHSAQLYASAAAKGVYPSMFRPTYSLMKEMFEAIRKTLPEGRILRVLEVGSGHGGTTAAVLPMLDPDHTEYVFTDISQYFLQNARSSFAKKFPFVKYRLYDVNATPAAAGLDPNSFDVVIAGSILHATYSIRQTLKNMLACLKPGGILCTVEQTEFMPWYDLGMGLQQGFDVFTDLDFRKDNPLISGKAWCDEMIKAGFAEAAVVKSTGDSMSMARDVLISRAPDSVMKFDEEKTRRCLEKQLPPYMVPSSCILLDRFPVNRSGKLDRKSLPKVFLKRKEASENIELPRTDAEKKLAMVWGEVLGVNNIGRDSNFFELGGDSLLCATLIAKIRQAFNVELSIHDMYSLPDLMSMASHIEGKALSDGPKMRHMVMKKEGRGAPWFFVPGAEGDPLVFQEMAEKLDAPSYCMLLNPADSGASTEELAERFLSEIKKLHTEGPVNIAGFCMGGFVAADIARRIRDEGGCLGRTVVIDSFVVPEEMRTDIMMLAMYLGGTGIPYQVFRNFEHHDLMSMLLKRYWESNEVIPEVYGKLDFASLEKMHEREMLASAHEALGEALTHGMTLGQFEQGYDMFKAGVEAESSYRAAAGLEIDLVYGIDGSSKVMSPTRYWEECGCRFTLAMVPGEHASMMRGSSLDRIVEIMTK